MHVTQVNEVEEMHRIIYAYRMSAAIHEYIRAYPNIPARVCKGEVMFTTIVWLGHTIECGV